MKWLLRYLQELWNLAFSRLAPYQRFISLIIIAAGFVGLTWLHTFLGLILLGLLAFLFFFVAPACLWHQQDLKLRLIGQPRPLVIIDGYEGIYVEDDKTGQRYLVDVLHIVNRGDAPPLTSRCHL
jgi:hypothetical protein